MPITTISNCIMAYLADLGVDRVFLVPGGGNMFLVDAVGAEPRIEFVPTHHEQAAVIAAEYYARKTGRLGVAVVTTGPGSSNALTGIAGAFFDSVPLLVLAGQVKTADYNEDGRLRQKGPQEIDLVSMAKNLTKMAKTCFDPDTVPQDIEAAVMVAFSGRPGPVMLEVPLDVQSKITNGDRFNALTVSRHSPDAENFEADPKMQSACASIGDRLIAAKKPLLVIGHGVASSRHTDTIRNFVRDHRLPVSLTWPMMDFLPFEDELNAGRFGVVAKRYANIVIQKSDYILVLGSRLDNIQTAFNIDRFGKNAFIDVVDVDSEELAKMPDRFACHEYNLVSFVPELVRALGALSSFDSHQGWVEEIAALRQKFGFETFKSTEEETDRISIYDFIERLSDGFAGGETIVTGSSGLSVEVFYTHFRNKPDQWISLTTGLGAMGYGLPAAVGVTSVSDQKIYLFESDGSLMMNLQELQTLKTLNRPMTIFLLNNEGYASIRATQENYFEGRFVGTGPSSGLEMPQFEKVAEAFGFDYIAISDIDHVDHQIGQAVTHQGLLICEVFVRKDEKLMPKCSVIRTNDNQLLSAPIEDMTPLLSIDEFKSIMGDQIDPLSVRIRS